AIEMKLSFYLRSTLTLVVLDALFWFGSRPERYRVFVLTLFAISASSIFLILLRTRLRIRKILEAEIAKSVRTKTRYRSGRLPNQKRASRTTRVKVERR